MTDNDYGNKLQKRGLKWKNAFAESRLEGFETYRIDESSLQLMTIQNAKHGCFCQSDLQIYG